MTSTSASAFGTAANRNTDLILPLNAVVVYGDVPAGKHAVGVLQQMGAHLQDEFKLVLWRLNLMAVPRWRAIATDDVAAAGLIVVATSEGGQLRDFINDWMQECMARSQGKLVAMLTPVGPHEAWVTWLRDLRQIYTIRPGGSAGLVLAPSRFRSNTFA